MLLLCGCSSSFDDDIIVTDYTCKFSQNGTEGRVDCRKDAVIFSEICVDGEAVGLTVTVTEGRYSVETENNTAEYLFEESDTFPLAELGRELLTAAATGEVDGNADVDNNGFITKISTKSGVEYTLTSHSKK